MSKTMRHSASFLQTFHTAKTAAQRTAESQTATPTDRMDLDPAAVAFARGQAAPAARAPRPTPATEEVTVGGKTLNIPTGAEFASVKQVRWMMGIALFRELPVGATADSLFIRLEQGFARSAASKFITAYKDLPKLAPSAAAMEAIAPGAPTPDPKPAVADGRYAVEHEGVLKFYRVTNGRKPGFVFLNVFASDDQHPIRSRAIIDEVLGLIAVAPEAAAVRFGQEMGSCYRCGRSLTDATSRDLGIGPDCRNK